MEKVPLLDHYTAASSSLHQIVSTKLHSSSGRRDNRSESGDGHSQSLHTQHPHSTHYQHAQEKMARSTTLKHHTHKSNSDFEADYGRELSDQLTLRPPATFSDINPIAKTPSSFQSIQKTAHTNQQLVRAQPPSNNLSSLMISNQHGSVAEVVETTKSSEFSNASVESLVSLNILYILRINGNLNFLVRSKFLL